MKKKKYTCKQSSDRIFYAMQEIHKRCDAELIRPIKKSIPKNEREKIKAKYEKMSERKKAKVKMKEDNRLKKERKMRRIAEEARHVIISKVCKKHNISEAFIRVLGGWVSESYCSCEEPILAGKQGHRYCVICDKKYLD